MIKRFAVYAILPLLFFGGCSLDPNWDVEALAPVAETTLTPGHIFRDSNLITQPGDDLVLDYRAKVFSFPVEDLLNIPDSTYSYNFISPVNLSIQPGYPLVVYNNYLLFNLPDISLREAILLGGKLRVEVYSTATQPAEINFQIPKAKINGVPFSFTDNLLPAAPGETTFYSKEFDISGYTIDFTGDNGNLFNKLRMYIVATINADAQAFPVAAGQEVIRTDISFISAKPYFAKGQLNPRELDIASDTVNLPFMHLIQSGMLDIDDVELALDIQNGFGVDARCLFQQVKGINTRNGNQVSLSHPLMGNSINLNAAVYNNAAPPNFFASAYPLVFHSGNSNFEQFAVNFPDKLSVSGNFSLNPQGNLSSGNDFVFHNSEAAVFAHLTAPLAFSATNLVLRDTVSINGESLKKNNPLKKGLLRIYARNLFPMEMEVKLQTVDSLGQVSATPASNQLIAAGIAASDGRVYDPVNSMVTVEFNEQQFEKLTEAKGLIFEVRFHTLPQPGLLKMYHDYFLHLKVVAKLTAGL
jgi:hypothetical protein